MFSRSGHPLDGAFQRVDRAQEHLLELKQLLDSFRQRYLDAVTIYFNPDPPYHPHVIHPRLTPATEHLFGIVVGEICYNLRSALDYLVYELALSDSGVVQNGTQFPIDDTPKKFAGHVPTRLIGLSAAHVAAIERLQPYNGCNWPKVLRILSNPDKHRQLTPRGGSFMIEIVPDGFEPSFPAPMNAKRRAKRPDGVEVEVELIAALGITIPVTDTPPIPIGDFAEETLEKLISEVRDLLETFKLEF
jgi:hypothetical protein